MACGIVIFWMSHELLILVCTLNMYTGGLPLLVFSLEWLVSAYSYSKSICSTHEELFMQATFSAESIEEEDDEDDEDEIDLGGSSPSSDFVLGQFPCCHFSDKCSHRCWWY